MATYTQLKFQIVFANPLQISVNPIEPDELRVTIDTSTIKDPELDTEIEANEPILIDLPRQIDEEQVKLIKDTMQVAQSSANTVASSNVLVNFILGTSLKFLWGMINTL